jgi:hypothetical protein
MWNPFKWLAKRDREQSEFMVHAVFVRLGLIQSQEVIQPVELAYWVRHLGLLCGSWVMLNRDIASQYNRLERLEDIERPIERFP